MEINFFETPPCKIGKHFWRIVVRNGSSYGRVTEYQWMSLDFPFWNKETEWPTWDGNDTYCGLPKSLSKIYRDHKSSINLYLQEPLP